MFKKGDTVFYGVDGVCEIVDISTIEIPGIDKDRSYYILRQKSGNGTIYVPADCDTPKMRRLISREEALELISKIRDLEPLKLKNEKKPEAEYKEVLQKYDYLSVLKLIKCIYFRKQKRLCEGKRLTSADERYMRLAEDMLYQEIGAALGIPRGDVLNYLISKIDGVSDQAE